MNKRSWQAQISGAAKGNDRDNDRTGSWSVEPTPTSIRREQAEETRRRQADEETRRPAEVPRPRPATGDRPAGQYRTGLQGRGRQVELDDLPEAERLRVIEEAIALHARGLVRPAPTDQRVRERAPAVVFARQDVRPVEDVQAPAALLGARPASGRKRQGGSRNHPRKPVVPPEPEDC